LLIDEMSCSSGDIFPIMAQDANAVDLTFGTKTIGCGGNVVGVKSLGHSDIGFRITESLAVRAKPVTLPDGSTTRYIENVDAFPDIQYQISGDDFRDNYENYRNRIKQLILGMIQGR